MLFKAKSLLILPFFALLTFSSCENEIIDSNFNSQNTIDPNSNLVNLMQSTCANDGSVDDILDDANCFSVNLPVTITINGVTITINTLDDLQLIENLYNQFQNDDDVLNFLFPITITLNDYTEFVINNQEALEAFIVQCNEVDEVIECIDFQYPISFSIYNANFQVIDTIVIENDQALYQFLQSLETSNNGAVLASLNFPVTMIYANGETLEVNNNQELETAINAAEDDCDDSDDCTEEDIDAYLEECHWKLASYNSNANNVFLQYDFYFYEGGNLQAFNGATTVAIAGHWSTSQSDQGVVLTLSNLSAFNQDLGGHWLVVACDDDRLELVRQNANNTTTIVFEQVCETTANNCTHEEVRSYLVDCPQIPTLNGHTPSLTSFNFHNSNELSTLYEGDLVFNGTWDIAMIENQLTIFINFNGLNDYNGEWIVVECSDNGLVLHQGDDVLLLSQNCNTDNPFTCFESFDAEIVACAETTEGFATFDLTQVYANCIEPATQTVTYHISLADAETGSNALPNPSAYTNLSNPQTIYVRVQFNDNSNIAFFEIGLVVENCNNGNCLESEVHDYLLECIWNVVNYNGSNDLVIYNFNFNNDGTVSITNNGTTITAMWSTSTSANGVVVVFSNVSGPNIQAITGSWTVVECQNNRLQFVRNNDTMVMERTCG